MSDITNCLDEFKKQFNRDPTNVEYIMFVSDKIYEKISNPSPNIIKCKFNWWDKLKWKFGMRIKVKGAKISDVRVE